MLDENKTNFSATGLRQTSLIRLSFLAVTPGTRIRGSIGKIDASLHKQLLQRSADFLVSK